MAAEPPHVADHSRRRFIANAASHSGLTAAAAAALTRSLAFPGLCRDPRPAGDHGLPGGAQGQRRGARLFLWRRVPGGAAGGVLQAVRGTLSGIKVIESQGPDTSKVKAMVDTGNIEYDVGRVRPLLRAQPRQEGRLLGGDRLRRCSTWTTSTRRSATNTPSTCCPMARSSATAPMPSRVTCRPASMDLFDTKKFPGARSLASRLRRIGAGPGGCDHGDRRFRRRRCILSTSTSAYASLAKIKPDVDKWWTAGAIPAQLLNDGEVVMATAWNGRIYAIQQTGAKVAPVWNDGLLRTDVWAIPKGRQEQGPTRRNSLPSSPWRSRRRGSPT